MSQPSMAISAPWRYKLLCLPVQHHRLQHVGGIEYVEIPHSGIAHRPPRSRGWRRGSLGCPRSKPAVEIDDTCTGTLRLNRPRWNVVTKDIRELDGHDYRGANLVAGGVPCSPFSIAGKQRGADDERDLFPEAVRIIREARPTAVMLENVPRLATARFDAYRVNMLLELERLDYVPAWKVLNGSAFGVPQLRPRFVLVAMQRPYFQG